MKNKLILIGIITLMCGILMLNTNSVSAAKSKFTIKTIDGKKTLVKYNGKNKIVQVPKGVVEIGEFAFKNNKHIEKVKFSSTVTTIKHGCFENCKKLKVVKFNKNLKRIIDQPFRDCINLKKLRLNKNIKHISEFGLIGMPNLEKITVAKQNKYFKIYKGALYSKNMKELLIYPGKAKKRKEFIISKKTRFVNACAFSNNKYLKKIVVKNSVAIGEDAFDSMKALKTVIFEKPYRVSGEFHNCKNLTTVKLAEGTEQICEEQFYGCKNLTAINFPNSLKFIGKNAFKGCTKLVLPEFADTITVEKPIR